MHSLHYYMIFFPIEFLLNSAVVARYKIQETCDTLLLKGQLKVASAFICLVLTVIFTTNSFSHLDSTGYIYSFLLTH